MNRPEDTFTSTVDGAAAFERMHAEEPYDDRPDQYDLQEGEDDWLQPETAFAVDTCPPECTQHPGHEGDCT